MAVTIDDSGEVIAWKIRQGDGFPKAPYEFVLQDPAGVPLAGYITSARATVRTSFASEAELGAVSTADVGSGLELIEAGAGVRLAAGTFDTDDWPLTETDGVPANLQEPCRADVEVTVAATGDPDTIVTIALTVLPQVSR